MITSLLIVSNTSDSIYFTKQAFIHYFPCSCTI